MTVGGAGPARRLGAGVIVLLGSVGSALADWRINGFFQQRADYASDIVSGGGDDSRRLRTVSDLGFVASTQQENLTLSLSPGLRFSYDPDDEASTRDRINFRFNGGARYAGPRLSLNANLSIIPDFATGRGIEDAVLTPGAGTGADAEDPAAEPPADPDDPFFGDDLFVRERTAVEITTRGSLGASYALSPTTSLSGSVFARDRRFSTNDDNLTPSLAVGARLNAGAQLTPLTRLTISPGVTRFTADSADDRETLTYTLTAGASTRLTPTIGFGANAGATYVEDSRRGADGRRRTTDDIAFSGGANLSLAGRTSSYSLRLAQSVDQSDTGDIRNRTVLSANASHQINPLSQLSYGASLALETPLLGSGDDDRRVLGVTTRYSRTLSRDWVGAVGVRLRYEQDDSSSDELSSVVFLQVSRALSLLP